MILLLGGTAESGPIALGLAEAGHAVLLSTATDVPLQIPAHPLVQRRRGRLSHLELRDIAVARRVRVLVDATHPYAEEAHKAAHWASTDLAIPLFRFVRPSSLDPNDAVLRVSDHVAAAREACPLGGPPVLLTIGSRHLDPYVFASIEGGVEVFARVLESHESIDACLRAGLTADHILLGRGPYSRAQNQEAIRRCGASVLVTKDSGEAGGVRTKLEAAWAEGCRVVVVDRPPVPIAGILTDVPSLIAAVTRWMSTDTGGHG